MFLKMLSFIILPLIHLYLCIDMCCNANKLFLFAVYCALNVIIIIIYSYSRVIKFTFFLLFIIKYNDYYISDITRHIFHLHNIDDYYLYVLLHSKCLLKADQQN